MKSRDKLRLLLLSDIHYLSLYEEMDPNAALRSAFMKDMADYRANYGEIDHILVCGDIAFSGLKIEYDAALKFFEQLIGVVGCKPEEIYIVPGNHDKNFNAPSAELRHVIHAGLSNESIDADKFFVELLKNNFSQIKALYQPFKDYQDFALKMVSTEPLMTKCLIEQDDTVYDNSTDKAYMVANLGTIDNYPVILYAMNTSLCSDWFDIDDFEKGHKLFLPKLSYNTVIDKKGCVNIAMMHHPVSRLLRGERIARALDRNFHIQIFGHLHQPVSNEEGVVRINSGALQPPKDEYDKSEGYFSVYNILELGMSKENGLDNLNVMLRVERYDENNKEFVEIEEESKSFVLPLKKHESRWCKEKQTRVKPEVFPEGVSDRTVKYKFLQIENPKAIMKRMNYSYDENKSHNMNCIDFLNKMQSEQRMLELWNTINL